MIRQSISREGEARATCGGGGDQQVKYGRSERYRARSMGWIFRSLVFTACVGSIERNGGVEDGCEKEGHALRG